MTLLFWVAPLLITAIGGLSFLRHKRLRGLRLYHQSLERALADGILTEDETRELASVRKETDLSEAEVRMVALSLYRRALRDAVADSRITEQEDEVLQRMRTQLDLSDRDLRGDVAQLQRIRLLAEIERGRLPQVQVPVQLATGEAGHWVMQARLADHLLTPGRRSELRSVKFDIASTAPFSACGDRAELRTSEETLPVDMGMLVVTDRRLLYRGARRTVAVPHMKLGLVELYKDGIAVQSTDPVHHNTFLVDDPELTAAVLLCAARARRREVGNLTTRTA